MSQVSQKLTGILLALVLALGTVSTSRAQEVSERSEGRSETTIKTLEPLAETQQDPLAKLRNSAEPYFLISQTIERDYWPDINLRAKVLKAVTDKSLNSRVLAGIAMACANQKERTVVPQLVLAFGAGRFTDAEVSGVRGYVFARFHAENSIFPALEPVLLSSAKNAKHFQRLVDLVPYLVGEMQFNRPRPADVDRYAAFKLLLDIWAQLKGQESSTCGPLIAASLTQLAGDRVVFKDFAAWQSWFEYYRKKNEGTERLSESEILKDLLDASRLALSEAAKAHQSDVQELISIMTRDGEPPTRFLVSEDALISQMAFNSIKGMADSLTPERRSLAIKDLIVLMDTEELRPQTFQLLLQSCGRIGARGLKEERDALLQTILKPRFVDQAEILQAQIRAVGHVGDPKNFQRTEQLASFYDSASGPKRALLEPWINVRSAVVNTLASFKKGEAVIAKALDDPAPSLRALAAIYLPNAVKSPQKGITLLANKANNEEAFQPRERMLESLGKLLEKSQGQIGIADMEAIAACYRFKEGASRRLIVDLSLVCLNSPSDPQITKIAAEILARAFAGGNGDRSYSLEATIASPSEAAMEVLLTWFQGYKSPDEDWQNAAKHILESKNRDLASLWKIAVNLANRASSQWFREASRFGAGALAMDAKPDVLKALGGRRALSLELARWQAQSDSEDLWQLAQKELEERLKNPESSGPEIEVLLAGVLWSRANNLEEAALARKQRLRAVSMATSALGSSTLKANKKWTQSLALELANWQFDLGNWDDCVAKLLLSEQSGGLDANSQLLLAKALFLSQGHRADEALTRIEALEKDFRGSKGPNQIPLLRATMMLFSADCQRRLLSRAQLETLKEETPAETTRLLQAMLASETRIKALLGADLKTKLKPDDKKFLATELERVADWICYRLRAKETTPAQRAQFIDLLKSLAPKKLEAVKWPHDPKVSYSDYVQGIRGLIQPTHPDKKFLAAFLKDA